MNKERFKNVWFWTGLIGVILAAAGIDATTLTSWNALFNSIMGILRNPYMLGSVALAAIGVFVNPNTPGLKDNSRK